jgi:hypothetical protein
VISNCVRIVLAAGLLSFPAYATDPITLIAIDGQAAPDGNGMLSLSNGQYGFSLNNLGRVAYEAEYTGIAQANVNRFALIVSDGATDTTIARGGALNPGEGFRRGFSPVINNAGQVASYIFTGPGTTGVATLGRYETDGTFTQIAQNGQASPGYFAGDSTNNQPYRRFEIVNGRKFLDMNEQGDVGFMAELGVPTGSFPIASYIYTDQIGDARMMAITDSTGAGTGTLTALRSLSINDSQNFSYDASLRTFSPPTENFIGIVRSHRIDNDANFANNFSFSTITDSRDEIFTGYRPVITAGNGLTFSNINNNDQVAFSAVAQNVNNSQDQVRFIALADADDSVSVLVTVGDSVPSGSIRIFRSTYTSLNDFEQVAFIADVNTGTDFIWTLMVHDPNQGIVELVREGDAFMGSTINSFNAHFEINNAGQVAFSGRLADGRDFIGLVQGPLVPAPSAILALGLAGLTATRRRRG